MKTSWERIILDYYRNQGLESDGHDLYQDVCEVIELVPEHLRDRACNLVNDLLNRDSDGPSYLPWVVEAWEALFLEDTDV